MQTLIEHLNEGLLDDASTTAGKVDSALIKEWFDKYTKLLGKSDKILFLKNGDVKVHGDLLIKDFDGVALIKCKIKEFVGSLYIENCPNLASLAGWFDDEILSVVSNVKGDLSISKCGKITNLEGCPRTVEGNLSIMSNKNLRSLDGMPEMVFGNIYVMKNGKKFKEQDILSKLWKKEMFNDRKIFL